MKALLNLFKRTSTKEQQMEAAIPTPVTETVPQTKAEKAAQDYFADRPHIGQAIIIGLVGDQTEADVTVIDKALGHRITVRVPVNDYLESGALELAKRFSNTRAEIIRC